MNANVQLLFKPDFHSDESWYSIWFKAAKANYDGRHSILIRVSRDRLRGEGVEDNFYYPVNPLTFDVCSHLIGIAPQQMYAGTAHSFAEIVTPPSQEIDHIELSSGEYLPLINLSTARTHLRYRNKAQYCPLCLREAQYHR